MAAEYYADNFQTVQAFVEDLDDDSQAIITAKKLFKNKELPAQLAVIKANFMALVCSITSLEERIPLVGSMAIVDQLKRTLLIEPFATKLDSVLKKNPGYTTLKKITNVLNGSTEDFEGQEPDLTAKFANAPITSVDCERAFSASSKTCCLTKD